MNKTQAVKASGKDVILKAESIYGDIDTTILAMALNDGRQSNWIDVVFDVYVENSIKNSERSLRGEETGF